MNWLQTIPLSVAIPLASLIVTVLGTLIYKSFKEGREISFWPPKIGPKPEGKGSSEKLEKSTTTPLLKTSDLKTEDYPNEEFKGSRYIINDRITVGDYREYKLQSNYDFRIKVKEIKNTKAFGDSDVLAALLEIRLFDIPILYAGRDAITTREGEYLIAEKGYAYNISRLENQIYSLKGGFCFKVSLKHINPHSQNVDVETTIMFWEK